MQNAISPQTLKLLKKYQEEEETGRAIYLKMAKREKDLQNKAILEEIAHDERIHANVWKGYTGEEVGANKWRVLYYTILSKIMGYTFVIKLMEKGEYATTKAYEQLLAEIPEAEEIIVQEQAHEEKLNEMLDEERLQYVGAMVLGLNDALVELTGTIAGLTFAMANTKTAAMSGIITGIAATLSMAASNYLAEKADGNENAVKSSLYTGVAYLVTVVFLVLPYLLLPSHMYALAFAIMICTVVLIIFFFNYYISVAKALPFWQRFREMVCISLGVALISFIIGLLAKRLLGIDI